MKKILALFLLVVLFTFAACGSNPANKYDDLIAQGNFEEAKSFLSGQDEETVAIIEAKTQELKDTQKVFVTTTGRTQFVDDVTRMPNGYYSPSITVSNESGLIVASYVVVYRYYDSAKLPISDFLELSDDYANLLPDMDYKLTVDFIGSTRCSSEVESVEACVKEITYSDGGKWENPYYPHWRAAN